MTKNHQQIVIGSKKIIKHDKLDHQVDDPPPIISSAADNNNNGNNNNDMSKELLYHVIHKVPSGDGPYVRAKHAQKAGKVEEQILLLKQKLRLIYQRDAFNGRPTKTARSHGKKFQVSVQQELSRLLGNLGWAYMQQNNFISAEVVYRKAQMIDPDANKACNLSNCLIKQGRYNEARFVLNQVFQRQFNGCDDPKSRARAEELKIELETLFEPSHMEQQLSNMINFALEEDFVDGVQRLMEELGPNIRRPAKRLPIFEQIASFRDHEMAF